MGLRNFFFRTIFLYEFNLEKIILDSSLVLSDNNDTRAMFKAAATSKEIKTTSSLSRDFSNRDTGIIKKNTSIYKVIH